MAALILWFLCASITAHLALEKNRSGVGWFLVGCFTGVFGIILISLSARLLSRAEIAAEKRAAADFLKPKKRCSECAETILQISRRCRYCGHRFVAEAVESSPSTFRSFECEILEDEEEIAKAA